jgi:hypothetical protein
MARITVDIPDDLYERLKSAAERSSTSVSEAAIASLIRGVSETTSTRFTVEQARRLRDAFGDELDDPDDLRWDDDVLTDAEREERRRRLLAMPPIVPPVSQAVREDRDEGY